MSEVDRFIEHLNAVPCVLLMGQRLFGIEEKGNALFAAAGIEATGSVYQACLSKESRSVQGKLDDAGNAIDIGDRYKMVRRFPWRCVYTSAIDPTPYRLFHDPKKRPVTNVFESRQPDSERLILFRLFGATGRQSIAELPPSTRSELNNRRTANVEVIAQLPQFVGPTGRLFIAGWHPSMNDWLRPRDIGTSLNRLTKGQVLIFGLNGDDHGVLEEDDDFAPLIEDGKVILFDSTLPNILAQVDVLGYHLIDDALLSPDTFTISIAKHTPKVAKLRDLKRLEPIISLRLTLHEYKRLTETFSILGDDVDFVPGAETEEEKSLAFLEFLGRDPLTHLLDCDRFAFRRPVFEHDVKDAVFQLLDSPAPQEHSVVLTGQTGSGKSIMIALLALWLRRAGIPVILIDSRLVPPNRRHIEDFLQAIDSHSSVATAILWDGLESPEEYQRMSRWIASLGKKALVVGTSYQLSVGRSKKTKSTTLIDIPIEAEGEREQLLSHFRSFLPSKFSILQKYKTASYQNFFELIYYLTSASRARLVAGVDAEFSIHVQTLDAHLERHSETSDSEPSLGLFGHALREAYGDRFDSMLRGTISEDPKATLQTRSPALRLVESIMVVGSLGLPLPQSIALSLCHGGNSSDFEVYQEAFKEFPLIDAYEQYGNYFVRPRLRLEADIWTSRRYQNRLEILDVVLDVAGRIKCSDAKRHKSNELEFIVKLLQTVGSEGPETYRIPKGYGKIAECVGRIQTRCGRVNPRLLLVKANSLREHVQQEQTEFRNANGRLDQNKVDREVLLKWEAKLMSAEEALGEAEADVLQQLASSAQSRGARTMLAVLSTEKAATIGGQLICLVASLRIQHQASDFSKVSATLNRARNAWRRSLTIDEENARAIDTACWIIRNLLEECPISQEEKYDLLAEWNELIVSYEELDLNPAQLDKFETREHEFAKSLGDRNRLSEILQRSTERGNFSIHALIARGIAAEHGAKSALKYLRERCENHLFSERVLLSLLYRLWWQANTGFERFFTQEELVLRFDPSDWKQLLDMAKSRLAVEGESENQLAVFHAAWASLQLNFAKDAQEYFRLLDTISVGNFRRGRALALLSDPNGEPREFTGEARPGAYSHKGRVWIEDLRIEIPYVTAQFPDAAGGTLSGFHVALNYRGAFVQPGSTFHNKQARRRQEERKE